MLYRAAATAGVVLAEHELPVVRTGIEPRTPIMHRARLNRAAPLTPALLLAPAGCDVPERTPRVLLLAGDFAAALAHPDTNALRVGVRPVTGMSDHPAVCPRQPVCRPGGKWLLNLGTRHLVSCHVVHAVRLVGGSVHSRVGADLRRRWHLWMITVEGGQVSVGYRRVTREWAREEGGCQSSGGER